MRRCEKCSTLSSTPSLEAAVYRALAYLPVVPVSFLGGAWLAVAKPRDDWGKRRRKKRLR